MAYEAYEEVRGKAVLVVRGVLDCLSNNNADPDGKYMAPHMGVKELLGVANAHLEQHGQDETGMYYLNITLGALANGGLVTKTVASVRSKRARGVKYYLKYEQLVKWNAWIDANPDWGNSYPADEEYDTEGIPTRPEVFLYSDPYTNQLPYGEAHRTQGWIKGFFPEGSTIEVKEPGGRVTRFIPPSEKYPSGLVAVRGDNGVWRKRK